MLKYAISDLLQLNDLPPRADDRLVAVPFASAVADSPTLRVAVLCHAYYPDLVDWLLSMAHDRLPASARFYLSTDTPQKADALRTALAAISHRLDIRVLPNRGRDIAPKLLGFADVLPDFDVVLFVHAKRSPHASPLSGWRDHTLHHVAGTPQIARSVLAIFEQQPKVGIIAAPHYEQIRPWCAWGVNFQPCAALCQRLGVQLSPNAFLDFPSGSMFWARPQALQPLLDLRLSWDDFPEERGQTDGTMAHAIERLFFIASEIAGFRNVKVADRSSAQTASLFAAADQASEVGKIANDGLRLVRETTIAGSPSLMVIERSRRTTWLRNVVRVLRRGYTKTMGAPR